MCVIVVSKLHEFLLKVHWLSYFFPASKMTYIVSSGALNSTHSLTHSYFFRQRRLRLRINASYFYTTTQGIRLRRRVDVFSTTSDTMACQFVAATWYRFFPTTRTCPELYLEISLFVECHPASKVALSNIPSHHGATICSDDVILVFFASLPRVGIRGFREAGGLDHMTKYCVLIGPHPS